jgi:hypothetical protein
MATSTASRTGSGPLARRFDSSSELQRDLPAEADIFGQVHLAHAS